MQLNFRVGQLRIKLSTPLVPCCCLDTLFKVILIFEFTIVPQKRIVSNYFPLLFSKILHMISSLAVACTIFALIKN